MPSELSVMSFNLRYGTAEDGPDRWEYRRPGVFETLSCLRPDVIGVQEALTFQIQEILERLPGYRFVGVGREDGKELGEHSAILYNAEKLESLESATFWLSDHPDQPGTNDWGDSNVRVCTWSAFRSLGEDFRFAMFNTHLAVASQLARERGVQAILNQAAKRPEPVIITGDFNADEDNRCIQEMRDAGFRDSYRELSPSGPAPTYNGYQLSYSDEKIDYIWVDSRAKVTDAQIVHDQIEGRWISDHFPITANLEFGA